MIPIDTTGSQSKVTLSRINIKPCTHRFSLMYTHKNSSNIEIIEISYGPDYMNYMLTIDSFIDSRQQTVWKDESLSDPAEDGNNSVW